MSSSNGRDREPLRRENPKIFDIRQIDNDMSDGLVRSPYYHLEQRTTPWEDTRKNIFFDIFKLDEVYYFNASDEHKHLIARLKYPLKPSIYVELKGHRLSSTLISGFLFITLDREIFMKIVFPRVFPRVETLTDACWRSLMSHNLDVRPLLPKIFCDEYDDIAKFYTAKRNYDKPATCVSYYCFSDLAIGRSSNRHKL